MGTQTVQLIVATDEQGTRLDRYAAEKVADLSRSYARQLIEESHIRLNGGDARPSTQLRAGDVVTIERPAPQPTGLLAEPIPLAVVYEDADLVVIDKPAGMVVHPAPGHPAGTLVNALLARYPDMAIGSDLRPGIVHRLDRDTSGLLVVARNERILHALQQQQQARTMIKIYLALVEGSFKELAGTIDAPIARHPTDRIRMAVVANGREARSHWQVREAFGEYTLLAVRLETGRTHQIRVHVSWKHHPIVGDPLYGPRRPRHTFGLKRQFLHAWRLGFVHPTSGMPVEWQSELPADLQAVLTRLRSRIR